MKKIVIQFGTAILFAFLCLASGRAAQTPKPAAPNVNALPLPVNTPPGQQSAFISVFTDNPTFGKDPFFPKSTRRVARAAVGTNSLLAAGQLPTGMVLKGLSGTKEEPLAIINNYTFAKGEEREIRVGVAIYSVKVVEIRERSVMVQVNGTEPRELTFRSGVY